MKIKWPRMPEMPKMPELPNIEFEEGITKAQGAEIIALLRQISEQLMEMGTAG